MPNGQWLTSGCQLPTFLEQPADYRAPPGEGARLPRWVLQHPVRLADLLRVGTPRALPQRLNGGKRGLTATSAGNPEPPASRCLSTGGPVLRGLEVARTGPPVDDTATGPDGLGDVGSPGWGALLVAGVYCTPTRGNLRLNDWRTPTQCWRRAFVSIASWPVAHVEELCVQLVMGAVQPPGSGCSLRR